MLVPIQLMEFAILLELLEFDPTQNGRYSTHSHPTILPESQIMNKKLSDIEFIISLLSYEFIQHYSETLIPPDERKYEYSLHLGSCDCLRTGSFIFHLCLIVKKTHAGMSLYLNSMSCSGKLRPQD